MANLHSQFKQFEERISLTATQRDQITRRHATMRDVITAYFKKMPEIPVPDFYIQGSYKLHTMVQKKDGSFDVDLGVYFPKKPVLTPTSMQQHVMNAVKDQTSNGAQHLKKCIRVIYSGEFNVDLPVYYQENANALAYIAIKNENWRQDDPEKFVDWVNDQRKRREINNDGQLLRIIKYMKRWANLRSFKTPSGVALTVWACNHFSASKDRDDISFANTLHNIYNALCWSVSCQCPVAPYDDLVGNLDSGQKDKFKTALKALKDEAAKAAQTSDSAAAVTLLAQHLGDKFKL